MNCQLALENRTLVWYNKCMNKALKFRLYPTKTQMQMFAKTFGCCRKVWNLMLSDKIESYKTTGKFVSVTPAQYKSDYPYLKEVDSLALANTQLNLQSAFRNCFCKTRKKRNAFPKYKSAKHSRKSYTTNNQKGTVAILGNSIRLPKVGAVKAVIHRMPDPDWRLKSATISQDSDGKYYASVLFEYESTPTESVLCAENAIGLDYSSKSLYVDSDGNHGSHHKYYRESQKRLAKEQRRLSRKTGSRKGESKSSNYLKQLHKINKIHKHISNQRKDQLHKLSTGIANRYDIVCVESLNMKSLANRSFGNGRSTLDNGYGMFLGMLEYKLSDRGKCLVRVDKWFPSSQLCHCCGTINPLAKKLDVRKWTCPACGETHDRDINAAKNILTEGMRIYKQQFVA